MNEYEYCPKCSRLYNVSRLRDRTKVFVCADCVNRDREKMLGVKILPIYSPEGLARVRA